MAVCVVAVIAVGARIWWINANRLEIPVERFGMDEWVGLDGTSFGISNSPSQGYSVKVSDAKVMSAQEYLDRYAEGSSYNPANPNEPQVVLELSVRNDRELVEDDTDIDTVGAIDMVSTILVPRDAGGMMYQADYSLWAEAEEAFDSDSIMWVGVMPGTEYTMHVPFRFVRVIGADEPVGAEKPVSDTFDLVVGISPVRREIEVTI